MNMCINLNYYWSGPGILTIIMISHDFKICRGMITIILYIVIALVSLDSALCFNQP
jgi:hypothetical protein